MKKIFFLLAFAFIGIQAYSQVYMLAILDENASEQCDDQNKLTLLKIDPTGAETITCICSNDGAIYYELEVSSCLSELNSEINSIINDGYELIKISTPSTEGDGIIGHYGTSEFPENPWHLNAGSIFIFAAPWNPSGLEEVPQTLKNLNIHPNPANTHIDVVLDYDILSSSEIVIYSAAGYVYHKEVVSNLNKNEPYRLDISRVPAGQYLITIVNDKTYTTAQKLIVI